MKYELRKLNCVQETDSEERRDELIAKGYELMPKAAKAAQGSRVGRKNDACKDKDQIGSSGDIKQ